MRRRSFLQWISAAGLAVASLRPARAGIADVRLTRHAVRWPCARPMRIAHLTDLHVGFGTPSAVLEQAVTLTRSVRPDVTVLTGDYVNVSLWYEQELRAVLSALPRPCVATLGNHDYWSDPEEVAAILEDCGILVLRNASAVLTVAGQPLTIVGIDDATTGHDDVAAAFALVSAGEPVVVLTHHPNTVERIAPYGAPLVLAGHTHGGQIDIPKITSFVASLAGLRLLAGWYEVDRTRLFVNAGLGCAVLPTRVGRNAAPEVAFFDLG